MTEDQIECAVARKVDRLDARFLNTAMPQTDYAAAMREIHEWAESEYRWAELTRATAREG